MNKGKRKIVQAATSGKKAPGARKPRTKKPPPDPWAHKEDYCPYPPEAETPHSDGGLTYRQERFIENYLDCDGNATEAYVRAFGGGRVVAATMACRLMKIDHIVEEIARQRELLAKKLGVTREKLLRVQAAIAFTTMDDLTDVMWSPRREDSYRGLGDKRHAIKSIKIGEHGNELTMADKQVAINELWKKLGFKEGIDPGDSEADSGGILDTVRTILGGRKKE